MWNKTFALISSFTFWFVFFCALCLAITTLAWMFGVLYFIPAWMLMPTAIGIIWSFCAGTIPIISDGIQRIAKWVNDAL